MLFDEARVKYEFSRDKRGLSGLNSWIPNINDLPGTRAGEAEPWRRPFTGKLLLPYLWLVVGNGPKVILKTSLR